jgi:transposase, IS6 family
MILLAVWWCLRFSLFVPRLSYRDVEELLAERGLRADHVTVWRWVQRYAPELERRLRSRLNSTNYTYLHDVLPRLPSMTNRQIKDIVPKAWAVS